MFFFKSKWWMYPSDDLWFILMKLLDVGEIVLSQVERGAQGLNQADSITLKSRRNIRIWFLLNSITHDFGIALIVMPTTVVKCNLSSLKPFLRLMRKPKTNDDCMSALVFLCSKMKTHSHKQNTEFVSHLPVLSHTVTASQVTGSC